MKTLSLILILLLCLTGCAETIVGCEEYVTLRQTPSTSAAALARVPLGAEVEVCPFTFCEYEGQTGYILSEYLSGGRVVRCNEYVTLRAFPSTSASALAKVPLGAEVRLFSDEFTLCFYDGMYGFILSRYLGAGEGADVWATAVIDHCDEWVSLRAAPSTDASRLAKVPLGTRVEAGNVSGDFTLCVFGEQEGYILSKYLSYETPVSESHAEGTVFPNVREFLTLRVRPGANAPEAARIAPGTPLTLLGWTGGFARVSLPSGQTGYVHTAYLQCPDAIPSWPYDHDAVMAQAQALAAGGAELEILGESLDGRAIPVLRFGSGDTHILIQGGIHGRELMTAPLTLALLRQTMEEHPGGLDGVTLHVLPMMNPDGAQIAAHGASSLKDGELSARASAMLGEADHRDWKANARGVDLNRNFPTGWEALPERVNGIKGYRGDAPLSEPESSILADYVRRYPFAATVSYHSFGSAIFCEGKGPAQARSLELAQTMSDHLGYPIQPEGSSSEKGGFKDWALTDLGIPSVTIEIGAGGSVGSAEELSALLLRHQGSWALLASQLC